jgi:thiamine transport system permease protein
LPYRPFRLAGGTVVAIAIAALIATLLWSILDAARTPPTSGAHFDLGGLVYITTLQAGLSTVLSVIVGVALAWALNRLRFPGRGLVIALFAAAIVTPGLVVAFGLLDVWGRTGWFGALNIPVFGLGGVVAAHVVLDATFAARILLNRLDAIPDLRLKTGQSLALSPWTRFAVLDWPAMRGTLPGLAAIIFLLAFTSFPIVLLLGGGPAVQTLELAIYSAVRLDFDLAAAVHLALIQIGLCTVIILASSALAPVSSSLDIPPTQRWSDAGVARLLQWLVLVLCLIGFALPLASVLVDGMQGFPAIIQQPAFWNALLTSAWIAAAASILSFALALIVAVARAATRVRWLRVALGAPAYAYLAVPAVTLSLGAFIFIRDLGLPPESAAPAVLVTANALLTLPFAVATLAPALDTITMTRGRLIRALSLDTTRQFFMVEWPLIARDGGLVLALGFCFSLGDLGVIALFGTQNFTTLPLLMVRALGAYRGHEAAAIAALMLVLTIAAFFALPRLFARFADARP